MAAETTEAKAAAARLIRATKSRVAAEKEWQAAIAEAHAADLSHRAIGPLAGVSHQRVAQIIHQQHNGKEHP